MYDPYAKDTPGVADPAKNIYLITPDDDDDLVVGVKALRIWNPTEDAGVIDVTTAKGERVELFVPPLALWIEPLHVHKVWEANTTPELVIHGYTDYQTES